MSGLLPAQPQWLFRPRDLLRTPASRSLDDGEPALPLLVQLDKIAEAVQVANRLIASHFAIKKNVESARHAAAVTALYINRFFMRADVRDFAPRELAWTALFLGLKDVERASRLETIVRLVLSKMYSNNKPMFMRLVSAPTSSSEPEFQRIQRIMLYHEEIFAATLCYDFNAETPHPGFARGWRKQFGPEWELGISERQRYEAIGAQFIDIGMTTPLPVLQPPGVIACAASILTQFLLFKHQRSIDELLDDLPLFGRFYDLEMEKGREDVEEAICWLLRLYLNCDPYSSDTAVFKALDIKPKTLRKFRVNLGSWAIRRPKPLDSPGFPEYVAVDADLEVEELEEGEMDEYALAPPTELLSGGVTPGMSTTSGDKTPAPSSPPPPDAAQVESDGQVPPPPPTIGQESLSELPLPNDEFAKPHPNKGFRKSAFQNVSSSNTPDRRAQLHDNVKGLVPAPRPPQPDGQPPPPPPPSSSGPPPPPPPSSDPPRPPSPAPAADQPNASSSNSRSPQQGWGASGWGPSETSGWDSTNAGPQSRQSSNRSPMRDGRRRPGSSTRFSPVTSEAAGTPQRPGGSSWQQPSVGSASGSARPEPSTEAGWTPTAQSDGWTDEVYRPAGQRSSDGGSHRRGSLEHGRPNDGPPGGGEWKRPDWGVGQPPWPSRSSYQSSHGPSGVQGRHRDGRHSDGHHLPARPGDHHDSSSSHSRPPPFEQDIPYDPSSDRSRHASGPSSYDNRRFGQPAREPYPGRGGDSYRPDRSHSHSRSHEGDESGLDYGDSSTGRLREDTGGSARRRRDDDGDRSYDSAKRVRLDTAGSSSSRRSISPRRSTADSREHHHHRDRRDLYEVADRCRHDRQQVVEDTTRGMRSWSDDRQDGPSNGGLGDVEMEEGEVDTRSLESGEVETKPRPFSQSTTDNKASLASRIQTDESTPAVRSSTPPPVDQPASRPRTEFESEPALKDDVPANKGEPSRQGAEPDVKRSVVAKKEKGEPKVDVPPSQDRASSQETKPVAPSLIVPPQVLDTPSRQASSLLPRSPVRSPHEADGPSAAALSPAPVKRSIIKKSFKYDISSAESHVSTASSISDLIPVDNELPPSDPLPPTENELAPASPKRKEPQTPDSPKPSTSINLKPTPSLSGKANGKPIIKPPQAGNRLFGALSSIGLKKKAP